MKQIEIKQIHLLNFKGVRNLLVDFVGNVTTISGDNGTGKTTIFDAFTWALFGKDSEDRKAFNIKTLDRQGTAIEKLPHEVTATFVVDNQVVTIRRCFNEKWQKRRGSAIEEFTGHEEERFINDVPYSVKDFSSKINELFCSEEIFKLITNPFAFNGLKTDKQRNILTTMIGEISDAEIANGYTDFQDLLKSLQGKSLDEYRKEITAKKRVIKTEITTIPSRIDEQKRNVIDVNANIIAEEANKLEQRLSEINEQLTSIVNAEEASNKAISEQYDIIRTKERELNDYKIRLTTELMQGYNDTMQRIANINGRINLAKADSDRKQVMIARYKEIIENCNQRRNELIVNWKTINAESLVFDDNEFVCPTCKRPFDEGEIAIRKAEMIENFNGNKTRRLARNNELGKQNNEDKVKAENAVRELQLGIEDNNVEIAGLLQSLPKTVEKPNIELAIANSEEIKALQAEIDNLRKQITAPTTNESKQQLISERDSINAVLRESQRQLAMADGNKRINDRIAELELQYRSQCEALAELEGIEHTIELFSKRKTELIEHKVNELFSVVKFKMFESLINGGEVETCVATINGVPFADLNSASRINAGLDIINAISKHYDVVAPIFIDNAESINDIMATQSQQVRLQVSNETTLTIK